MKIRNMLLLLLLFLFVCTACRPAEAGQAESAFEEPVPIAEELIPAPEEPEPVSPPAHAAIKAKTQQASICPCLAVEHSG